MRRRRFAPPVAVLACGALVLSACADNGDTGADGEGGDTITLAADQPYQSYNNTTAGANSAANADVNEWVTTGFWSYQGSDGLPEPNEEFGTYEQVSEDPLVVDYSINDEAVWSDGEPIDCADVMLWWAQQSGESDYSNISSNGIEDTTVPDCAPGEKDFTLEYEQPFADWEWNGPSHGNTTMMPAHVVAEQGGISTEDLIEAVQAEDWETLEPTVEFFNDGWVLDGELPPEETIPSSGPYQLESYDANLQAVTLVPNENYWGEQPATETIVIQEVPEEEQVQALENQEVDVIDPQATRDIAEQIDAAEAAGIESEVGDEYSYEHLDFNFDDGPFADNFALREAFALCVPRQTIVENLIQPISEDAETKDVRNIAPWDPGFEESVDQSSEELEQYGQQDLEQSQQILEEEDAMGTEITLATLDNERRNNTGTLISEACEEAGFEVNFQSAADFFDTSGGLSEGQFDVAMFAWVGSSLVSPWNSTFETPTECTPEGKGNNNGCYSDEGMDEMLDEVLRQTDEEEVNQITADIEQQLWADLVTIPLFQHPNINAWQEDVQNIEPNPAQTGVVWNMPEWERG